MAAHAAPARTPRTPDHADTPEASGREDYEERAAIIEYEGNLSRAQAERLAGQLQPGPWAPTTEDA